MPGDGRTLGMTGKHDVANGPVRLIDAMGRARIRQMSIRILGKSPPQPGVPRSCAQPGRTLSALGPLAVEPSIRGGIETACLGPDLMPI